MTCPEARALLDRLLDGALDPVEERALGDHLAACATCRGRADAEGRLEAAIAGALSEPGPDADAAWERAMARLPAPRRSRAPVVAAAAGLLLAGAAALWLALPRHREVDLAAALLACHGDLLANRVTLTEAPIGEACRSLRSRIEGLPKLPPALPEGFILAGSGVCYRDGTPIGYLAVHRGAAPLSVAVLPPASRAAFPEAWARVESPGGLFHCRASGLSFCAFRADDGLAAALGDVSPADLEALAGAWRR
ncbi:MAG: zf-HC2 domain-containing protein [Planctomycetales bacterium]|nr:zf-HC2 domain-containing protein [Planctomycetales bacterium]